MMRFDYQHAAPAGMKALGGVYMYVAGCGLPKALVDLAYLRASQINACAYCVDSHSHDLLAAGEPLAKLMLVSRGKRRATRSTRANGPRWLGRRP
jgi:AhpD family alkylhydroperoxidase